jgi:hypothetical protein
MTTQQYGLYSDRASVESFVWFDGNGNGIQDNGEAGLQGINVTLFNNAGARVATTTTDAAGVYHFDIAAGVQYSIKITAPAIDPEGDGIFSQSYPTSRDQGADDTVDSDIDVSGASTLFSVPVGQSELNMDAGLGYAGKISGVKFNDRNSDGILNPGDEALPGWTIFIDANGNGTFDSGEIFTSTDATGSFVFSNLAPGSYRLTRIAKAGWTATTASVIVDVSAGLTTTGAAIGDHAAAFDTAQPKTAPSVKVNTFDASLVPAPVVAFDKLGGWVMAWATLDDSQGGIAARRYNASGQAVGGEISVNSSTTGEQHDPAVAVAADGSFVVVWTSSPTSTEFEVRAQRFDAVGNSVGSELLVFRQVGAPYPTVSRTASVVSIASGGFAIVWNSSGVSVGEEVFARLYSASGVPLGSDFAVNTTNSGNQYAPSVASDAQGNLVVAWASSPLTGSTPGVYAQWLTASGTRIGTEIRVSTVSRTSADVKVTIGPSNEWAVVWAAAGTNPAVFARRYAPNRTPVGPDFMVSSLVPDVQPQPSAAIDRFGNLIVSWVGPIDGTGSGVSARKFNASGVAQGAEFRVAGNGARHPDVAVDAGGNFLIAFGVAASPGAVYAQEYSSRLLGDIDGDGKVGFADLVAIAQNYGKSARTLAQGDWTGDGLVDFADLVLIAQTYGTALPQPAAPIALPAPAPALSKTASPIAWPKKPDVFSQRRIKPQAVALIAHPPPHVDLQSPRPRPIRQSLP